MDMEFRYASLKESRHLEDQEEEIAIWEMGCKDVK
jgi:hypothetical protein